MAQNMKKGCFRNSQLSFSYWRQIFHILNGNFTLHAHPFGWNIELSWHSFPWWMLCLLSWQFPFFRKSLIFGQKVTLSTLKKIANEDYMLRKSFKYVMSGKCEISILSEMFEYQSWQGGYPEYLVQSWHKGLGVLSKNLSWHKV